MNTSTQRVAPALSLSSRQSEILQLIWDGLESREIAARLSIGKKTVEAHRHILMAKFGVNNRAKLLRAALEAGILTINV